MDPWPTIFNFRDDDDGTAPPLFGETSASTLPTPAASIIRIIGIYIHDEERVFASLLFRRNKKEETGSMSVSDERGKQRSSTTRESRVTRRIAKKPTACVLHTVRGGKWVHKNGVFENIQ
jgi:hypothetical protein